MRGIGCSGGLDLLMYKIEYTSYPSYPMNGLFVLMDHGIVSKQDHMDVLYIHSLHVYAVM